MSDRRQKDSNWQLNINPDGTVSNGDARLSVLMDIRDELKRLNAVLNCPNFLQVPQILRKIRGNTSRIPGAR